MLRKTWLLDRPLAMLALTLAVFACGKDTASTAPITPPPPPPPPPAVNVLLKDIVIPLLPSPYYHFEYDTTGRISAVSFASGLTMYDVTYDGNRIAEFHNNIFVNHDRLVYSYDDAGRVGMIRYVDSEGITFTNVFFSYEGQRLTGVARDRRVEGGFIVDKTMSFTYYSDGNLKDLTEHRPPVAGVQEEATFVTHFEQYDAGTNVDAFGLLHDEFFDHLVFLPGVLLQKGNPGRETRTGDGQNYTVDYTYAYDDRHRPLSKNGDLVLLNGTDAGKHFQTTSLFTYY
jgi:hypothetical protein